MERLERQETPAHTARGYVERALRGGGAERLGSVFQARARNGTIAAQRGGRYIHSLKNPWVEALKGRVLDVKQRVEATAQRVAAARVPIRGSGDHLGSGDQLGSGGGGLAETGRGAVPALHEEPPVVARMIVEIRSDGTRTVARGALEDIITGERVKIEASGGSPAQLAASLASNLLSTPFMLGRAAGALVLGRLGRGGSKQK